MSRMYTQPFAAVAVTASQDLWEITSPSDAVTKIHLITFGQYTDFKDAEEEILSVLFKRGATSSGTGGTQATTPPPVEFGDVAYGGVVDINNTTKASGGTIVTQHADVWNVRTPFLWVPTPEIRIVISPSQRFTVELSAPADSITMNGVIYFEEIGG